MKVKIEDAVKFIPFDLKIRVETEEEMNTLYEAISRITFAPRERAIVSVIDDLMCPLKDRGAKKL